MTMREIPRYRWEAFIDDFSRAHRGSVCTLEVDSSVAGPETEASSWPFQGLVLETGHGAPHIQVFVGDQRERHLGHDLVEPQRLWLEQNTEGAQTGLRIDADEGAIHIRFRTPREPEYVETYLP